MKSGRWRIRLTAVNGIWRNSAADWGMHRNTANCKRCIPALARWDGRHRPASRIYRKAALAASIAVSMNQRAHWTVQSPRRRHQGLPPASSNTYAASGMSGEPVPDAMLGASYPAYGLAAFLRGLRVFVTALTSLITTPSPNRVVNVSPVFTCLTCFSTVPSAALVTL